MFFINALKVNLGYVCEFKGASTLQEFCSTTFFYSIEKDGKKIGSMHIDASFVNGRAVCIFIDCNYDFERIKNEISKHIPLSFEKHHDVYYANFEAEDR